MEYCQLGDLSVYIKQRGVLRSVEPPDKQKVDSSLANEWGGLHEDIVRHFLRQFRSAMEFLRSHSLVHRDLKSQVCPFLVACDN
jgi:serine/threonine-protein kinase ULK2